jgi:hypothetical protein
MLDLYKFVTYIFSDRIMCHVSIETTKLFVFMIKYNGYFIQILTFSLTEKVGYTFYFLYVFQEGDDDGSDDENSDDDVNDTMVTMCAQFTCIQCMIV